jgi:hypothetical protein
MSSTDMNMPMTRTTSGMSQPEAESVERRPDARTIAEVATG